MNEVEKASYMARRQWIVEVLGTLIWHWELAEWLQALIGSAYVTPEMIDGVEVVLKEAIKNGKDEYTKQLLQAGIDAINALKEKELLEHNTEVWNVENLVATNFI